MINNVNKNKKVLRAGIWYTVSNILLKSIGVIITPIFTRVLSTNEFGAYNNYVSWMNIILIFSTLNLESTFISARYDYEHQFDEYILSVLSLSTISSLSWLTIANIFQVRFQQFLGMDQRYINCMLVYLLFYPAVNMFQIRNRFLYKYKSSVISGLGIALATSLLSIVLVLSLENKLDGRIYGSILPTIFAGVFFYLFFIKRGKRITVSYWKYALPICLPYIPHLLSLSILNSIDRIMITRMCGETENALYSLAYSCGTMVTLLAGSLNNTYAPWLGEQLQYKNYKRIREISRKYIIVFCFFAVGFVWVAPEVLYILGGETYLDSRCVIAPVAMGCVCQFLYMMFVNIEQFEKHTSGMAVASVSAAMLNGVLNYIFIPIYGYVAAAYTTLAGYVFLLVAHMFLVWKLGYSEVYDYKFVMWVIPFIIGMAKLADILYQFYCIRYITGILYFILLVLGALKAKRTNTSFV